MAILNILHYPDPRLRTKAQPIKAVDEAIRRQIQDMFETMYAAPGIGLAATQVDFHQRLIVLDISEDKTQPLVLINPEILTQQGEQQYDEGCLSVPGFYEPVDRAATIRVRALDKDGRQFELDADGLLAVCIQHEMDHLEGKLFVDYLTEMKRQRIRKKLIKQQKHEAVSL
jgi:peptide deformylase